MIKYSACIYARLSKEDKEKQESESITNQIQMIKSYVSNTNDINITMTKIDDGYTGSNFNRPSFKEMIEEIKKGTINCIIVKDFSRFGRNFIDSAKYIEKIFPMLNVRFISINDNYDSLKENEENNLIIPFKNLINDAYVKDISIKVKSQKNMKMKNGEFIGSFTTYGYLKDPNNKGKLIVDMVASEIVKEIFNLKIKGYSNKKIADKLNENGVLSPMEHKKYIGVNFSTNFKKNDKAKWGAVTITRILKNKIYTGVLEQGKTTTINHKINLKLKKDEKDWYVIENNHPPIISKEIFERVQKLLLKDTRTAPKNDIVYNFSGIIFCGDCGRSMVRKNCGTKENPNYHFICSGYKNKTGCTSHLTKCDIIEKIILLSLKNQINLFVNVEKIIREIEKKPYKNTKIKILNENILSKETELNLYKKYKFKIYEDYQENLITKSEFLEYNMKYQKNIEDTVKIIENLNEEIKKISKNGFKNLNFIDDLKKYKNITCLERSLIVNLINKIEILNNKKIIIYFNFRDEFKEALNDIKEFVDKNEYLESVVSG